MRPRLALLVAPLLVLPVACGALRSASPPGASSELRVAVMPFRTGGHLDPAGRFVASTAGTEVTDDVGADAAARLARELAQLGERVIDQDVVLRATPVAGAALYGPQLAARVARDVGADVAVMGAIGRFEQRRGSALGVESPASVEYQAMAVAADTGIVIGSYSVDYTQKPLAEDLTDMPSFIQGGGKWRTREEILERSLRGAARKIASALRSRAAAR